MKRKLLSSLISAALLGFAAGAQAQAKISDDIVKIAVLTDLSGVYSDLSGSGSVLAARMAIGDFAKDKKVLGKNIELISADTQNKPDVAATQAREWYDKDKVDVIVDLVATNVALAVLEVGKQKNKITLISGAASLPITNENCTATNVHWMYDTYALSVAVQKLATLIKRNPKATFSVEGYTDSLGSPDYNLELSQRRADSVKQYLVDVMGIIPAQIETKGYGASKFLIAPRSVAVNSPEEQIEIERQRPNRRVVIVVHTDAR